MRRYATGTSQAFRHNRTSITCTAFNYTVTIHEVCYSPFASSSIGTACSVWLRIRSDHAFFTIFGVNLRRTNLVQTGSQRSVQSLATGNIIASVSINGFTAFLTICRMSINLVAFLCSKRNKRLNSGLLLFTTYSRYACKRLGMSDIGLFQ